MKLNKIMIATLMAMGVSSFSYAADQGHGKVNFKGSIIDAPCTVHPDSIDQTVDLGQVSNRVLADGGKSELRPFSIKLENCDFGTPAAKNKVTTTFNGVVAPETNNKLLNISGSASGAGVGIQSYQGEDVVMGKPTSAVELAGNGDNELKFSGYLQGLSSDSAAVAIVPGDFTAVANFQLAYQ